MNIEKRAIFLEENRYTVVAVNWVCCSEWFQADESSETFIN